MTTESDIAAALKTRHSAYVGGNEAEWGVDLDAIDRAAAAKLLMLIMDRINDDSDEMLFAVPSDDHWTERGLIAFLESAGLDIRETDDPLVLALSLIDEVQGTTPRWPSVGV